MRFGTPPPRRHRPVRSFLTWRYARLTTLADGLPTENTLSAFLLFFFRFGLYFCRRYYWRRRRFRCCVAGVAGAEAARGGRKCVHILIIVKPFEKILVTFGIIISFIFRFLRRRCRRYSILPKISSNISSEVVGQLQIQVVQVQVEIHGRQRTATSALFPSPSSSEPLFFAVDVAPPPPKISSSIASSSIFPSEKKIIHSYYLNL